MKRLRPNKVLLQPKRPLQAHQNPKAKLPRRKNLLHHHLTLLLFPLHLKQARKKAAKSLHQDQSRSHSRMIKLKLAIVRAKEVETRPRRVTLTLRTLRLIKKSLRSRSRSQTERQLQERPHPKKSHLRQVL